MQNDMEYGKENFGQFNDLMGIVRLKILVVHASAGTAIRKKHSRFSGRQELLPNTSALAFFFRGRRVFGLLGFYVKRRIA
jgi:hypothetical protein